MCDPSREVMVCIWSCSAVWFLCVRGLPRAHRALVASHLVVSS